MILLMEGPEHRVYVWWAGGWWEGDEGRWLTTVGWEPNTLLILEATGRDGRLESKPNLALQRSFCW